MFEAIPTRLARPASLLAALLLVAPLGKPRIALAQPEAGAGRLVRLEVPAPALAGNFLGDPTLQPVAVYLPPGYDASPQRRYPVLYLLHGIGGSPEDWLSGGYQGLSVSALMDSLLGAGAIEPFLVVMPNGTNRYGGSFYRNSPVTGGWEDWIWRDLVGWVDATYRTLPRAEHRGIAGHSMGGLGALWMGMRHPDVFSAVWAMNPCCLAMVEDVSLGNPAWSGMDRFTSLDGLLAEAARGDFYPLAIVALAAVLSPRVDRPPLYVELPARTESGIVVPSDPAHAEWLAAFPIARAREHAANLQRLRVLRFDTAFDDEFGHIPPGARMLADTLAAIGVPHVFEMYEGDHRNRMRSRMTSEVLPLFSRALARPEP